MCEMRHNHTHTCNASGHQFSHWTTILVFRLGRMLHSDRKENEKKRKQIVENVLNKYTDTQTNEKNTTMDKSSRKVHLMCWNRYRKKTTAIIWIGVSTSDVCNVHFSIHMLVCTVVFVVYVCRKKNDGIIDNARFRQQLFVNMKHRIHIYIYICFCTSKNTYRCCSNTKWTSTNKAKLVNVHWKKFV